LQGVFGFALRAEQRHAGTADRLPMRLDQQRRGAFTVVLRQSLNDGLVVAR